LEELSRCILFIRRLRYCEDDKLLCFQLLKGVEVKFAGIWQTHKNKGFEDIYKEMTWMPNARGSKKGILPRK